jgi:hypothetical protein
LNYKRAASEIKVEHFSEIIFFPFRLSFADKPHNSKPFSFEDISKQLCEAPSSCWKEGNARVQHLKTRTGPPLTSDQWPDLQHAQSHAYFHPFIRQFLFDNSFYDNDYRLAFHRTDINLIRVQLAGKFADRKPVGEEKPESRILEFVVKRCELEVVRMGVALLVLEIESKEQLTLDIVQAIQNQLRRTYSPYFDDYVPVGRHNLPDVLSSHMPRLVELANIDANSQVRILASTKNPDASFNSIDAIHADELYRRFERPCSTDQLPKAIEPDAIPVGAHWEYLLSPFLPRIECNSSLLRFIPLGDDRLPIMSYIAVEDPRAITRGDWVRLCFADNPGGDRLPYAQEFLTKFEENYCYDRYWYKSRESKSSPSRIVNSGMTFCWVGSAHWKDYFSNPKNGALATFRTIYSRLGLLAHLQKAAMLTSAIRISELSERKSWYQAAPPDYIKQKELIDQFYREFIEFTHVYWFDEVTPQLQGIELFSAWQGHLNIHQLQNEVRQELIDLTNVVNAAQQERQSKAAIELSERTLKLTRYAIGFGILSFVVGFFGMNFFASEGSQFKVTVPRFNDMMALMRTNWISIGVHFLTIALFALIGVWLAVQFVRVFDKKRRD